jgi:hypothetical protein
VLAAPPKNRGRRRAEIAAWSVLVFLLYFYHRVNIGEWISELLSEVIAIETKNPSPGMIVRLRKIKSSLIPLGL